MNDLQAVLDERRGNEISQLGIDLYNSRWRDVMETQYAGQVAAIHLDSGDCEVGRNSSIATRKLRERHPDGYTVAIDIGPVSSDDPLTRPLLRMR